MAKPSDPRADVYALLGDEHGESLFDSLDDVQFWIKDTQGRYVRVNRALLDNYGFRDAAAVVGHTDAELLPPHLADQYQRDDRAVLAGREIRGRIELVARADRSTGWHVTNKLPLRARDGRIVGSAGITRDLDPKSAVGRTVSALAPVVERLRAHPEAPLQKRMLARLIGRSVRSLERRFAAAFGTSLLKHQRALRMHRACQLLITSDEPITGIALSLGYGDHSHFTREFRRMFGLPPRAYRARWFQGGDAGEPAD